VLIANGKGGLILGRVGIEYGRITEILDPDGPSDYRLPPGAIVAPGLIDLHTNGAEDRHFNRDQGAAVEVASRSYARTGTTGFLATIMTAPWESMLYAASELAEAANTLEESGIPNGARCLGIHFEGPFLNPRGRGIHRPECLLPATPERLEAIMEATAGALIMVTMAPEAEGVEEAARFFTERGVVCSVGHTAARYHDGVDAIERGFRTVTHSFNAMPPLDHRDPSILLACLLDERVYPQVICDGVHVTPPIIGMLSRILGHRLILSTDNMPPAGSGYFVRDGVVRSEDGTIAGSILAPDQGVRNLMAFANIPFERAIMSATSSPAKLIGLERELGTIDVGLRADLSIWNANYEILATIVGGHPVHGFTSLEAAVDTELSRP
jgi:N-acetylglucosamine-6-phosphate deacetylase